MSLTNVDLTEESVHQVTGDEKDINMAALVATYLQEDENVFKGEEELLSNDLKYFISTRAVKLKQINLLLWATLMSLDFITSLNDPQRVRDCCQLLRVLSF